MEKEKLKKMNPKQIATIAVAYLLDAEDERPEGTERFFKKLDEFQVSIAETHAAINEAEKSLRELKLQSNHLFGAVGSISELIAEDLPEDKIIEWAEKFEPPKQNRPMSNKRTVPPGNRSGNQIDLAGATAGTRSNIVTPPPGFNPNK